jgi:predicted transcriptional regulator
MGNKYLMRADEIAEELGVSKPYAYKLMQKLNKELAEKGFLVINGRVSRKYFEEQIYGMSAGKEVKGV